MTSDDDSYVRSALQADPPDLQNARYDVHDVYRRARRRQVRPVAGVATLVVATAAVSTFLWSNAATDNGSVVAASPSSPTSVTPPDGLRTRANPCPPAARSIITPDNPEGVWPRLSEAAEKTRAYAEANGSDHYHGQEICMDTGIIILYRVPGNEGLDQKIRQIVEPYRDDGITVQFRDSTYSKWEMEQIAKEVWARGPSFGEGVKLVATHWRPSEDYVVVGVTGSLEQARTALQDLGTKVQIVSALDPFPHEQQN